jgi:hypothetical protein
MNVVFFLFTAMLAVAPPQAQDRARLVELARNGRAAEAWKIWRAQPASVERTRTGVLIAAAAQEIGTGVTLYTDLVAQSRQDDPEALRALAIGAASTLTTAKSDDVRIGACGILIRSGDAAPACADLLKSVRAEPSLDRQAIAIYRLANSGRRPWPELFFTLPDKLSSTTRLQIARRFTRLSAAERVELIAPIFDRDPDPMQQSAAATLLGDIPGPEALTVLHRVAARNLDYAVKLMVNLALARHGDADSLRYIQENRSSFVGPRLIDMGMALAAGRSPYGPDPKRLIDTTPGAERARVALGLMAREPEAARAALRAMMADTDPALREAALRAAGVAGLGREHTVYSHLTDPAPAARLAAIDAVLQTVGG